MLATVSRSVPGGWGDSGTSPRRSRRHPPSRAARRRRRASPRSRLSLSPSSNFCLNSPVRAASPSTAETAPPRDPRPCRAARSTRCRSGSPCPGGARARRRWPRDTRGVAALSPSSVWSVIATTSQPLAPHERRCHRPNSSPSENRVWTCVSAFSQTPGPAHASSRSNRGLAARCWSATVAPPTTASTMTLRSAFDIDSILSPTPHGRRTKGRRTRDEGRRTKDEDEGRRTKDEGRRTKDQVEGWWQNPRYGSALGYVDSEMLAADLAAVTD